MNRMKRIVSAIALTAFLLNTAVSDYAFAQNVNYTHNTDKLAPAKFTDDIGGSAPQRMFTAKAILEGLLKKAAGDAKSLSHMSRSEVATALAREFDAMPRESRKSTRFFFNEMPDVAVMPGPTAGLYQLCVRCDVNSGRGSETVYLTFGLERDEESGFPVQAFSRSEAESRYNALKRSQKEAQAGTQAIGRGSASGNYNNPKGAVTIKGRHTMLNIGESMVIGDSVTLKYTGKDAARAKILILSTEDTIVAPYENRNKLNKEWVVNGSPRITPFVIRRSDRDGISIKTADGSIITVHILTMKDAADRIEVVTDAPSNIVIDRAKTAMARARSAGINLPIAEDMDGRNVISVTLPGREPATVAMRNNESDSLVDTRAQLNKLLNNIGISVQTNFTDGNASMRLVFLYEGRSEEVDAANLSAEMLNAVFRALLGLAKPDQVGRESSSGERVTAEPQSATVLFGTHKTAECFNFYADKWTAIDAEAGKKGTDTLFVFEFAGIGLNDVMNIIGVREVDERLPEILQSNRGKISEAIGKMSQGLLMMSQAVASNKYPRSAIGEIFGGDGFTKAMFEYVYDNRVAAIPSPVDIDVAMKTLIADSYRSIASKALQEGNARKSVEFYKKHIEAAVASNVAREEALAGFVRSVLHQYKKMHVIVQIGGGHQKIMDIFSRNKIPAASFKDSAREGFMEGSPYVDLLSGKRNELLSKGSVTVSDSEIFAVIKGDVGTIAWRSLGLEEKADMASHAVIMKMSARLSDESVEKFINNISSFAGADGREIDNAKLAAWFDKNVNLTSQERKIFEDAIHSEADMVLKSAAFEKRIDGAFEVNPRSGMSMRMIDRRYNDENLPEDVIAASLSRLGFEQRGDSWYRVTKPREVTGKSGSRESAAGAKKRLTPQEAIDWLAPANIPTTDDIYDSFRSEFADRPEELAEFNRLVERRITNRAAGEEKAIKAYELIQDAVKGRELTRNEQFEIVHSIVSQHCPELVQSLDGLRNFINAPDADTVIQAINGKGYSSAERLVLRSAFLTSGEGMGEALPQVGVGVEIANRIVGLMAKRDALPKSADLLVVFGSPDSSLVAKEAAKLARELGIARIIVSGRFGQNFKPAADLGPDFGRDDKGNIARAEAMIMKDALIAAGIPSSAIWTESDSQGMTDNGLFSVNNVLMPKIKEGYPAPKTIIFMHAPLMQLRGSLSLRNALSGVNLTAKVYDYAAPIAVNSTEKMKAILWQAGRIGPEIEPIIGKDRCEQIASLLSELKAAVETQAQPRNIHRYEDGNPEAEALRQGPYANAPDASGEKVSAISGVFEQFETMSGLPIVFKGANKEVLGATLNEMWASIFRALAFEKPIYRRVERENAAADERFTGKTAFATANEDTDIEELPVYDITKYKGAIRSGNAMQDVLSDPGAQTTPEAYFMYRGVFRSREDVQKAFYDNMIRYDVTIVPPARWGSETAKTYGHFHTPIEMPEIYQVISGEAWYLMQKTDDTGKVVDVIMVKARPGDFVIMLPGYGHVSINPSEDKPLVMANWLTWHQSSFYGTGAQTSGADKRRSYKENRGAAYYVNIGPEGDLRMMPNPTYGDLPPLRQMASADKIDEFALVRGEPIYNLVERRDFASRVRFLNHPSDYEESLKPENTLTKVNPGDAVPVVRSPDQSTPFAAFDPRETLIWNFDEQSLVKYIAQTKRALEQAIKVRNDIVSEGAEDEILGRSNDDIRQLEHQVETLKARLLELRKNVVDESASASPTAVGSAVDSGINIGDGLLDAESVVEPADPSTLTEPQRVIEEFEEDGQNPARESSSGVTSLPASLGEVAMLGKKISDESQGLYKLLLPMEFFAGKLADHQQRFGSRFKLDGVSGLTMANSSGDAGKEYIDKLLEKIAPGEEGATVAIVPSGLAASQVERLKARKGIRVVAMDISLLQGMGDKTGVKDKESFQVNTYAMMYAMRNVKGAGDEALLRKILDYFVSGHLDLADGMTLEAYVEALANNDVEKMIRACLKPVVPVNAKEEYDNLSYPLIFA